MTGQPERIRIIAFEGSFHGRSYGAISAAGSEKMVKGFGPVVPGFDHVPFGDLAAIENAIRPETAAVLIEPIQGEGGIRVLPREDLRALRALCDAHGLLLDPRRDPVRHGADRAALPPRVGGDHAGHHDGGEGDRRRLPARRLPRHRGGGGRDDHRARTARPTAATRWPAPWAAR